MAPNLVMISPFCEHFFVFVAIWLHMASIKNSGPNTITSSIWPRVFYTGTMWPHGYRNSEKFTKVCSDGYG
jgi:hypothetical protein